MNKYKMFCSKKLMMTERIGVIFDVTVELKKKSRKIYTVELMRV